MREKIVRGMELARLMAARKAGVASEDEEGRLEELLAEVPEWRGLYEGFMAGDVEAERVGVKAEEAWRGLEERMGWRGRGAGWRWLAVAGMVVLCVGLGRLWMRGAGGEGGGGGTVAMAVAERSDAVCLEMPDGRVVNLGDGGSVEVLAEGVSVDRERGELGVCGVGEENVGEEGFYTLVVPKYGEYTVRFGEGTVVKVNSESRLRYPVRFGEGMREVWLEGEGFFEVAKDEGRGFTVHAGGMDVRVLGTVFHVGTRGGEGCAEATLLSGSVEAVCEGGRVRLVAGEQARLVEAGVVPEVRRVNVRAVTAWVRGMFCFEEERLEDILAYLSEWYGFRVDFRDERVRGRRFSVEVKRYGEARDVLRLIEETGAVRFREVGKTVEVYE